MLNHLVMAVSRLLVRELGAFVVFLLAPWMAFPAVEAATYVIQPPSQVVFSGTIAGQSWQPQDLGGLSFLAPLSGEIDATWEGDELVVGFASLVVGQGLWASGFPDAGSVLGGFGTTLNFSGRVDLGNGFVVDSTTYDFEISILAGRLFTSASSESLTVRTLSGISNYASPGSSVAQATSLAGGTASRVEAGPVMREASGSGEEIRFDLTVAFEGVTNVSGNQVPFTLAYAGPIVATSVPEPGVGLLIFVGAPMLISRRRFSRG